MSKGEMSSTGEWTLVVAPCVMDWKKSYFLL